MAVPDFQSLILPALQALADGAATPISRVRARVAATENLTADDRGRLSVTSPPATASDCGADRTADQWTRRWSGAVGPLEWGVGNVANKQHRRGEGNAVRVAHALETRCCRGGNGGLPGTGRYVLPKGGKSACHNALGRLRCAMWSVGRRISRLGVSGLLCVVVVNRAIARIASEVEGRDCSLLYPDASSVIVRDA